jgi:TPR repeat protein
MLWADSPIDQDIFGVRDKESVEAVESLNAAAVYKMSDYETARQSWLAVADRDNTSAMIDLANIYEQGQGVPRDLTKAVQWLEKAAAGRYPGVVEFLSSLKAQQ